MKAIVYLLIVGLITSLNAMGPGSGGKGNGGMGGPGQFGGAGKGNMDKMQNSYGQAKFDKYKVKTINATIDEVGANELNANNRGTGMHLYVRSNRGYYKIHVSPQFWIDKNNIVFTKGEKLKITGSEFEQKKEKNMYAVTIERTNGEKLHFRDAETGDGLWKSGMKGHGKSVKQDQGDGEEPSSMREKMMRENQEKMREQMMRKMQGNM